MFQPPATLPCGQTRAPPSLSWAISDAFEKEAQNAFASPTFYLAGKGQGCVHRVQVGHTWGPEMFGDMGQIAQQIPRDASQCKLHSMLPFGAVLREAPCHFIWHSAFGNKPSSISGPPVFPLVKWDNSLSFFEGTHSRGEMGY